MKLKGYMAAAAISAVATVLVIAGIGSETVPIHFNYAGVADRWGSKWVYAIFGLIPLFEMAAYGVYRHMARKRGKARPNEALENRIVPLIGLFLAALSWFLLLQIRSGQGALEPSTFCWILTGVGTLMMCVSNSMAKIRPNRTFGFRTPWTLKDETVWNRAHRVAGYAGVVGGAVIVAGSLMGMTLAVWMAFAGFLLGMIILVGVPMVYARNLYHRLHSGEK